MYSFRKSKKGFTLIELMVVVAIIAILALLGLRLYSTQQEKAKVALVRANAGTIQVQIQTALVDDSITQVQTSTSSATPAGDSSLIEESHIFNPYTGAQQTLNGTAGASAIDVPGANAGEVYVTESGGVFSINGNDSEGDPVYAILDLTAQK